MTQAVEVEVKARLTGREGQQLRNRLKLLGARLVSVMRQHDTYYNHPCRDFRRTDEVLRVRVTDGRVVLTYKGPRLAGESKAREEIEVEVGDDRSIKELLVRLGFKEVAVVEKVRETYELHYAGLRTLINVDEVEGLGLFVELEACVSPKEVGKAEEALRSLLRALDVKGPYIRESYLELMIAEGLITL